MNTMHGPYSAIGALVRMSRKRKGMTRRQLVKWIVMSRNLEVTRTGAAFMIRELEDDGLVMNSDVLKRMLDVLELQTDEVADLLTQARETSAAEFAAEMTSFAKTMAEDQGRSEREIMDGIALVVETQQCRPVA